ncbi:MAG: type II secretion system F family protein [Eubacteriales bacterium]|nr:type II secretion system F family protein [Sarcina sp.]MBR2729511.1 type II secretion system F family protein [Lachnospiraceae bacterium]MDO4417642.1 type II secretion system F family protein [Eubacteriales bacterium]
MAKQRKLDNLGVSAFCESMGMMVRAGIQTDEAVALLEQGTAEKEKGVLGAGITLMKERVEEGASLSDAMREAGIFPEYALKMVAAGETSGRQEDVLFRLSRYYRDQKTISEKIRSAVTYPAAMIVLIIAVLAVMLAMVLPAFTDVYDSLTGSLSASTYSYIRWAYGFCWFALVLMIVIAVCLFGGLYLWNNGKKEAVEKVLRRIPLCAEILDNMGMFRFTSALGTFLASGELQDIAVIDSIPMAECRPVEEKLKKCVARMEEGHSIAQAAYDEELFEPVYGRMLLAGERSGNMESVLERLTELLEENCTAKVDSLVGIVDPLLSGVLMFTVGLSLLSVMLPLIGMMNSIG